MTTQARHVPVVVLKLASFAEVSPLQSLAYARYVAKVRPARPGKAAYGITFRRSADRP